MIIGTRLLELHDGDRKLQIPINVFAPKLQKPGVWECRYDVGWPEGPRSYAGYGVDSIQALLIAFGMIGAELYASNYHKAGQLIWEKPGQGYGFPLPPTLRDLLQGDDAKYF